MHSATVAPETVHGSDVVVSTEHPLIDIVPEPLSRDLPKEPMNAFTLHLLSSFDKKDPRIHRSTFIRGKTGRFKDLARVARAIDVPPGTALDQIPDFLSNHPQGPMAPGGLLHLLAFSIERPGHHRLYPVAAWEQWVEEAVIETTPATDENTKEKKIKKTILFPRELSKNPVSDTIYFPLIGGTPHFREFRGDRMSKGIWNPDFQIIAYKPE